MGLIIRKNILLFPKEKHIARVIHSQVYLKNIFKHTDSNNWIIHYLFLK